jgi:hypothetical protein
VYSRWQAIRVVRQIPLLDPSAHDVDVDRRGLKDAVQTQGETRLVADLETDAM